MRRIGAKLVEIWGDVGDTCWSSRTHTRERHKGDAAQEIDIVKHIL